MGIIQTGPGGPLSGSSASGGKVYGFNNITNVANTLVANINAARTKIIFHNPGSVDIFVSQTVIQNTLGTAAVSPSDITFTPTTSSLGGTLRVYANGGTLTIDGECQKAWQALANAGTTNPLTVIETNV